MITEYLLRLSTEINLKTSPFWALQSDSLNNNKKPGSNVFSSGNAFTTPGLDISVGDAAKKHEPLNKYKNSILVQVKFNLINSRKIHNITSSYSGDYIVADSHSSTISNEKKLVENLVENISEDIKGKINSIINDI